VIDIIVLIL